MKSVHLSPESLQRASVSLELESLISLRQEATYLPKETIIYNNDYFKF